MTTGATGQLGLALPVQGELSGTWGDTVNNGITQYTNLAIAATLTLTNDGAVTLANTTGDATASNITSSLTGAGTVTAQHAIVRVTGTLTTTKVITGPSYSKTYVVINDATGGSVTIKASGQTGVTIAVGDKALVAYNGTDYVRVGASAGGSNTQVQYNSGGNLAGSANLTFDGTTLSAAALADASLTAGRVTYAGASGNLQDSANLTFDGTTLSASAIADASLTSGRVTYAGASGNLSDSSNLTFDGTTLTAAGLAGPLNGSVGATTPSTVVATQVNVTAQGDVRFEDTTGGQYVALQAPGTVSTNVTFTLPGADGSSGQAIITDGSGNLSFGSAGVSQAKVTAIAMVFGF